MGRQVPVSLGLRSWHPSVCAPTHTGLQLQLIEGTFVVIAEAAVEDDGAIRQDPEEVLAVSSARDDLRQSTVRPDSPLRDLGSNPSCALDHLCHPYQVT